MRVTLAAFTMASAASIMATRPRVSIIPNASPIVVLPDRRPGRRRYETLCQTARPQGFIHQPDQFGAREGHPLIVVFLGHHRAVRLSARPRLDPVARTRVKEFVHFHAR